MDRMKMGNFLSELRKEKNLSQSDLAEIIGVTFQAVSKWERGEAIPDITILEKLSSFYCVTIEDIINGEISARTKEVKTYEIKEVPKSKMGFLNQKRVFGFWFALAYLILFIILGFCPFATADLYNSSGIKVYMTTNYYNYIFNSSFGICNLFLLIQFLTTLCTIAFTMLFYACTSKKAFLALFRIRFVFIIINLLTLITNIVVFSGFYLEFSSGNFLIILLLLAFNILFLCLKRNRKSYLTQDFQ